MIEVGGGLVAGIFELLGLPERYPLGFVQLFTAAALGLAVIAVLTWADKRRAVEMRMERLYNPTQILWLFETLVLVVLLEWFIILVYAEGADLPSYSH